MFDSVHSIFFFTSLFKMAMLSNSADVPEQMTSEKILTSPVFLTGPPGLPGPPGKTCKPKDDETVSYSE